MQSVGSLMAANVKHTGGSAEANSPVHEYLVEATEVTDEVLRECSRRGSFGALSFELFKEAGSVVVVCGSTNKIDSSGDASLARNQAICAGLLIRCAKFMLSIAKLSVEPEHGEVIRALNRCIFESATNLEYLVLKNEADLYDQFVRSSLAPERERYDLIENNIEGRGGDQLPIETRMLASIRRVCDASGVKIDDIDPKYRAWGGGARNRLNALGLPDAYVATQRIPSHAVHGTWVDIYSYHLKSGQTGFEPDPTWMETDGEMLAPVSVVVLGAARKYLRSFLGDEPKLNPLYERIDDLEGRILKVFWAQEEWLSS